MPDPIPVTFSIKMKGYESQVTVDAREVDKAKDHVADWLDFQLRYLAVIQPGDKVQVTAPLRT